jgi:hypothetical protein
MTKRQAKRHIELMFDYHFIYSKETNNFKLFSGNLKDTVFDIQNRLDALIDEIYNDFNESQEGLRYTYEETITGLLTGAEDA